MVSIRRPRITPDKTSVSVAYLSIPDLAAQNRFRTVKTYSPIHYLNSNYSPKYGLNVLNYMLIALQWVDFHEETARNCPWELLYLMPQRSKIQMVVKSQSVSQCTLHKELKACVYFNHAAATVKWTKVTHGALFWVGSLSEIFFGAWVIFPYLGERRSLPTKGNKPDWMVSLHPAWITSRMTLGKFLLSSRSRNMIMRRSNLDEPLQNWCYGMIDTSDHSVHSQIGISCPSGRRLQIRQYLWY